MNISNLDLSQWVKYEFCVAGYLIEACHKYLFHFRTVVKSITKLDITMQQGEYVVIDSIFLLEINVETVPEHLCACIINQMLGDQDH